MYPEILAQGQSLWTYSSKHWKVHGWSRILGKNNKRHGIFLVMSKYLKLVLRNV